MALTINTYKPNQYKRSAIQNNVKIHLVRYSHSILMFLCVIEPLGQSTHRTNEEISRVHFIVFCAAETKSIQQKSHHFLILHSGKKNFPSSIIWMLNGQKSQSKILFPRYNCWMYYTHNNNNWFVNVIVFNLIRIDHVKRRYLFVNFCTRVFFVFVRWILIARDFVSTIPAIECI